MQQEPRIRNDVPHIRERIVRVIVQFRNGSTSVGTGFFIGDKGELLTCLHVITRAEKRSSQISDIKGYLTNNIMNIQAQLPDGSLEAIDLQKFDEDLDVALLKIRREIETPFFSTTIDYYPEYDESTFFCGFQLTGGYTDPMQYPFSTNRAVVSAFSEVQVAGGKYTHIQLNSINLGGNSGAPLFQEGGNVVIGIINGNMNWGGNNFAIVDNIVNNIASDTDGNNTVGLDNQNSTLNLSQRSIRVPLCIAYATPITLIREKTDIL
ncbi:MAG: serine protease [bacterium]